MGLVLVIMLPTNAQKSPIDSITTITLMEVNVVPSRTEKSEIGLSTYVLDSATFSYTAGQSLSQLLRYSSIGEIRPYGPTGLSSPALRGLNASHTAIVWNGITLNNPLLGQQDLSLFHVGLTDNVSIQKGGSASLYGSGAIGGTIQLTNDLKFRKHIRVETVSELGSFGRQAQNISASIGGKRLSAKTVIYNRRVANDFPYRNPYQNPVQGERRSNAGLQTVGFQQQAGWRINNEHMIGVITSFQNQEVEVPESIIASGQSRAAQDDDVIRGLIYYHFDRNRLGLSLKQAVIYQGSEFKDPDISLRSDNDYVSYIQQFQAEYRVTSRTEIFTGIQYENQQGSADNLTSDPTRNIFSMTVSARTNPIENLFLVFNGREELIDGIRTPFTPSMGLEWGISQNIKVKGNASRNYRIPTFNDLYWQGSGARGNPQLDAESSWNQEIGIEYLDSPSPGGIGVSVTVFNSQVTNWIQWYLSEQNYWTPENLREVWSRGIESTGTFNYQAGNTQLGLLSSYRMGISTLQKSPNQNTEGNQLLYTPIHSLNNSLLIGYKDLSIQIRHGYVGDQYTDESNSELRKLDAYGFLDISTGYKWHWQVFGGSIRFDVNNLTNAYFENRRGYPMYGRNYCLALSLNFES